MGTICGGKAVGISVDVNVFQPHILAANLAHAIGIYSKDQLLGTLYALESDGEI